MRPPPLGEPGPGVVVTPLLPRLAAYALLFVPMGALGTVLHELGHWAVAEALGCPASLHYGWTHLECAPLSATASTLVTLGGPVQTMVTGTLGLGLLWRLRGQAWGGRHVIALLMALFWSREVFNAAAYVVFQLGGMVPAERLVQGDELLLGLALGGPPELVLAVTGLVGVVAVLWVALEVPRAERVPLVVGGGVGSLLGFALWMSFLGPILLP